jgi:hypothetical protein
MLNDKEENQTNVNVESEEDIKSFSSPFLLDHISIVFTIIFFGCLIAFLIFRSNSTSERSTFYPCNQSFHYYSLHLDLSIDSFTELHRHVNIWVSGVRNKGGEKEVRPLNFTVDTTGIKKKTTVNFFRTPIKTTEFKFKEGETTSEKIPMTKVLLSSAYDQVKVHFILNSDFKDFTGMNVFWSFNTAPKPAYVTFLQILLPATTLYLTIHFLFHFTSMTEQFTQINIAILGVISVLASLPYGLIFGVSNLTKYPQFLFSSLMVAYFRYIVATQIQLEAEGRQSPSMKINLPIFIFFLIYAFVDLAVIFSNGANVSSLKTLMTIVNYAYIALSVGITILAFIKTENGYSRRLIFMVILEALSFLIVLRDQDYESVAASFHAPLQRSLTFGASHIFMVSYLLILLQICSDVGYTEIAAHNNDHASLLKKDTMGVEINVDQELEEEDIEDIKRDD